MDRDKTIQILMRQLEELNRRIIWLEKGNKALRSENALLKTENALLKAENVELKARLNSDSHNSNKPPSSDGYKKRSIKPAFSKSKNSSHGGQKGHEGKTLRQVELPDKTEFCIPDICSCGHGFTKEELELAERRQVFELPPAGLRLPNIRYLRVGVPFAGKSKKELRRMESMPRFNMATMQRRWLYC